METAIRLVSLSVGPVAVDDLVTAIFGQPVYDRRTGLMTAPLTVTNTSASPIWMPLHFVVNNISSPQVTLASPDGTTDDGFPYIDLSGLLTLGRLDPGATVTKQVSFNNPSRARFLATVSVLGVPAYGSQQATSAAKTISVGGPLLAGDIDGDGHVDVVDLLYFANAFGSVTGDANYDVRCDLNADGSVDVIDLLTMVASFGV